MSWERQLSEGKRGYEEVTLKQFFSSFAGAVENLGAIICLEINRCEPGYPVKLSCCDPGDHPAFSSGKSYGAVSGLTDNGYRVVTEHC